MPQEKPRQRHAEGLFIREYGDGASCDAIPGPARPIVWVHGLGESGLGFERIASHPRLAHRHQLVPDLPGYGRTPWAHSALSLVAAGDLLVSWLRKEGLWPALFLGHSMGGVLVQLLAERHPEAVAAMVNIDGNISIEDCHFSSKAADASLQAFEGGRFERLLDSIYREGLENPALRGYYASLRQTDPRAFHRNALELVELSKSNTLAQRMAALDLPKLYLAGHPGGASLRSLQQLANAGVPTRRIEPSGHWPFIDQPEAFLELLLPFLEGH